MLILLFAQSPGASYLRVISNAMRQMWTGYDSDILWSFVAVD